MRKGTAILIDFDNAFLGLKDSDPGAARDFAWNPVEWITDRTGATEIADRRVYLGHNLKHKAAGLAKTGAECVISTPIATRFNNTTDHQMVVDAMALAMSPNPPERVVLASSDADFSPLVHELQRRGIATIVIGNEYTSGALRNAATTFKTLARQPAAALPSHEPGLAEVIDISTRRPAPNEGRSA